eukprot:9515420-Alexandrium_andersonii.AAC.1
MLGASPRRGCFVGSSVEGSSHLLPPRERKPPAVRGAAQEVYHLPNPGPPSPGRPDCPLLPGDRLLAAG